MRDFDQPLREGKKNLDVKESFEDHGGWARLVISRAVGGTTANILGSRPAARRALQTGQGRARWEQDMTCASQNGLATNGAHARKKKHNKRKSTPVNWVVG